MYDTGTIELPGANTSTQIPSLTAIINPIDIQRGLNGVFTYPLCKVVESNRDEVMKILREKLSGTYPGISEDDIQDFLGSERGQRLLEQEIERERQQKIDYWQLYLKKIESGEAVNNTQKMGISLSNEELEMIAYAQLKLLGIATNRNTDTDNSFNSNGI